MSFPTLEVKIREIMGRKTSVIRAEGLVPGIIYGAGREPQSVQFDRIAFVKLYNKAGSSSIVELDLNGDKVNVLVYDYQLDPLRDEVIHADFRAVDMKKPLEADVRIVYVGEAAAVKALGGTLITPNDTLTIKALPADLPKSVEVDLSALVTFDDSIRVENLTLPNGVEAVTDANRTIAVVAPPRTEEEMSALDEAVEDAVGDVEVEGEKKEGEEGEEKTEGEDKSSEEKKKEDK